jgi:transposase
MEEYDEYDNGELFQTALGLIEPWRIHRVDFSIERERLDIHVRHNRGFKFICTNCTTNNGVHDTVKRTWRHLNFFQYETYLRCHVPRIRCTTCKKTTTIPVPWARTGSGFTLLFEAFAMELAKVMAISLVGLTVGEYDTRVMRIVTHHVSNARKSVDMSMVTKIGIDETNEKKGHNYITTFVDLEKERVLYATKGKDNATIKRFTKDLKAHRGNPDAIQTATIDLSPAYTKGVTDHLPKATITYDHFHVIGLINEAVDTVRREESKERKILKYSRYWWLKNPNNLKKKQAQKIQAMSIMNLKTARAYRIKLALQDIYNLTTMKEPERALKRWYYWATHSRIPAIIKVAKTIKKHWDGIMNYFKYRLTNGVVECFNGIIQTIKRRARGYRNTDNFITIVYLVKGKLNFNLPVVTGLTHYK